jgi:hypothetical protein
LQRKDGVLAEGPANMESASPDYSPDSRLLGRISGRFFDRLKELSVFLTPPERSLVAPFPILSNYKSMQLLKLRFPLFALPDSSSAARKALVA